MAMTETLSISQPEPLKRYVEQRVAEGGYGNSSEYISELIRREREETTRDAREKLEALLLEGSDSLKRGEGIEATPGYWQQRLSRLIARFQPEQGGAELSRL